MTVQIYSRFNSELQLIWCGFEPRAVLYGFQTYEWLCHWHEQIGKPVLNIQPQIVVVFHNGQVSAIFPFGIRRSYGIRILQWLGDRETDYHAPILATTWPADTDQFEVCWKEVLEKLLPVDVVHLRKQPRDIDSFFGLKKRSVLNNILTNTGTIINRIKIYL